MSTFLYFVRDRLVGEFTSPSSFAFSDLWICTRCGETQVRRMQLEGLPLFNFHHTTCAECAAKAEFLPQITEFRIPSESLWEPIEILAEEFLFNSGVTLAYESASTSTSNHPRT